MGAGWFGVLGLAFFWGFRHGVDWDHIAAIFDLTGSEQTRKQGFKLALIYAAGHEAVIVALGGTAVFLGRYLPDWLDRVMESFTGITLLLLSLAFINVLLRKNPDLVLVSRWRLLYTGAANLINWFMRRFAGKRHALEARLNLNMSGQGAFTIGVIHGIGAETPSQLLLFLAASGAHSHLAGELTVLLFAAGLLASHSMIALISLLGLARTFRHPGWPRGIGLVTAAYSLIVGAVFLMNSLAAVF